MLGSLIVREIKKNLCDGCDGHFAVLKVKLFVLSSSSSLKGNRGRIAPSVRLSLTAKAVVLFSLTVVSTPIVFCSGWWTLDSGQHYTILYGPSRSLDGDGDDNNDGDDDDDDVLFFSTEKRVVSLTRPVVFSLSPSPFANNRLRLASCSRLLDDSGTAEKRKELYRRRRRRRRGKGKKKKKKTAAAMHRSRKKKKTHIRQSLWHKRFRLTDTLEGAAAAAGCSLAHSLTHADTYCTVPSSCLSSPLLSSRLVSSYPSGLYFTLLYSPTSVRHRQKHRHAALAPFFCSFSFSYFCYYY